MIPVATQICHMKPQPRPLIGVPGCSAVSSSIRGYHQTRLAVVARRRSLPGSRRYCLPFHGTGARRGRQSTCRQVRRGQPWPAGKLPRTLQAADAASNPVGELRPSLPRHPGPEFRPSPGSRRFLPRQSVRRTVSRSVRSPVPRAAKSRATGRGPAAPPAPRPPLHPARPPTLREVAPCPVCRACGGAPSESARSAELRARAVLTWCGPPLAVAGTAGSSPCERLRP